MITNSREAHDTRIEVQYSDTYDLGGAGFSKLDWMAEAIAGIRRYSQRQWHHQLHVELCIVEQYSILLARWCIRPR